MKRILTQVGVLALAVAAGVTVIALVRQNRSKGSRPSAEELFDKYQARALLAALYEADPNDEGMERLLCGRPLPRGVERNISFEALPPLLERLADVIPLSELEALAAGEDQTVGYTLEQLHDAGELPYRIGRIINDPELSWTERIDAFREELSSWQI